MAPLSGHQLLPKVWRAARFAFEKATRALKPKLPEPPEATLRLQPAYARISHRQIADKKAGFRRTQTRYYSTARVTPSVSARCFKASRIGACLRSLTSRTPFASTLRPNLTGGAFCRTAGGYAVGAGRIGGARFFSNGPASPTQVLQNVSAGVRAFWLSGQRARFDGCDSKTGGKQYKVVTALQEEAGRKMQAVPRSAPGSYVEFQLSPTITAFGSLGALKKPLASDGYDTATLNTEGLMNLLSLDFARALKDFAAVLNDLKRLSTLGDLPLSLHDQCTLRVRFPGCDAESVERLCNEVGVQRGVIQQDEDFDMRNGTEMALLFPFAPSRVPSDAELFCVHDPLCRPGPDKVEWRHMMSPEETQPSPSISGQGYHYVDSFEKNPWAPSPSGYSSMDISELGDRAFFPELPGNNTCTTSSDYAGFEGIYKFIEECDRAKR